MADSRKKNVKRNLASGIINKIITLGFPFVTRTIIIWKLGADFLGLSSLFTSILEVLNMAELGFSSAVVFSMYKPIAVNDEKSVCALLNFYRRVYRAVGVIILLAGLCLTPFIPRLINGQCPEEINIYILYLLYLFNAVLSYVTFGYKNALLTADQRNDIISNINTVVMIFQKTLQIIVLIVWGDYYIFYLCTIVGTILNNILVALWTKKKYPQYVCKGKIDQDQEKNIKKQIGGLAIGKIGVTARNSFDSIFISLFCGLTQVAIYSNYYYIFSAITGIFSMIRVALSASVGNAIATKSVDDNYKDFKRIQIYFQTLTIFCCSCLISLYQPFMRLWAGESLTADFSIVILFAIYFYITCCGQTRSIYQEGAGIWWEIKFISIFESIANISLNAILGYKLGIYGILLATIITVALFSEILMTVKTFKIYFKRSPMEYFISLIIDALKVIFVSFCAFYVTNLISIDNSILEFIVKTIVCVFMSGALAGVFLLGNKYLKHAI